MPQPITIDGDYGEGGGQILRSSLALSLATGKPFQISNIRARRPRPGLMAPHLAAVEAAAQVAKAETRGLKLGSPQLEFTPRRTVPGWYDLVTGAKSSTTLVLQMLIPALARAAGPSTIKLTGATHFPLAPPFDFLLHAFLPILARLGPRVTLTLERPGIYPGGVGSFMADVEPARHAPPSPLDLIDRGKLLEISARALVVGLPIEIAQGQIDLIARQTGWDKSKLGAQRLEGRRGGGNVVIIQTRFEQVTEVFTGFGRMGQAPETVVQEVLDEAKTYLDSAAAVAHHLADQLLIPMALSSLAPASDAATPVVSEASAETAKPGGTSGGRFTTLPPSIHARTNMHVIEQFLGLTFAINPHGDKAWMIELR